VTSSRALVQQSGRRSPVTTRRLDRTTRGPADRTTARSIPPSAARHGTRLREPTSPGESHRHQRLPEQPAAAAATTQALGREVRAAAASTAPAVVLRTAMYTARAHRSRHTAGAVSEARFERAITGKIKHAVKHKTSPAILAQLLQPSLAFCFSLQPMTAYRPGLDGTPSLAAS